MMWLKIAMVVFVCTSMNHLGLIEAIEKTVGFKLPIINCCKCSSFLATLILLCPYSLRIGILASVAIAFLAAIAAVWLELIMGLFDTLYNRAYDRIFNKATVSKADGDKDSAETDNKSDTKAKVS